MSANEDALWSAIEPAVLAGQSLQEHLNRIAAARGPAVADSQSDIAIVREEYRTANEYVQFVDSFSRWLKGQAELLIQPPIEPDTH